MGRVSAPYTAITGGTSTTTSCTFPSSWWAPTSPPVAGSESRCRWSISSRLSSMPSTFRFQQGSIRGVSYPSCEKPASLVLPTSVASPTADSSWACARMATNTSSRRARTVRSRNSTTWTETRERSPTSRAFWVEPPAACANGRCGRRNRISRAALRRLRRSGTIESTSNNSAPWATSSRGTGPGRRFAALDPPDGEAPSRSARPVASPGEERDFLHGGTTLPSVGLRPRASGDALLTSQHEKFPESSRFEPERASTASCVALVRFLLTLFGGKGCRVFGRGRRGCSFPSGGQPRFVRVPHVGSPRHRKTATAQPVGS